MDKFVTPQLGLKAFTCPHCHVLAQMEFETHNFDADIVYNGGIMCPERTRTTYIARCHNCGGKIIWIDEDYIYPDMRPIEANDDMPDPVKKLYNEAGVIYMKSPRAACALLRLAIDRLCNELGENDRDINKNIAALVKRGMSIEIQKALDIVRVVGNKAVHPGQIAFDVDDIKTAEVLFALINMIVDKLITEPNRLNELYEALPNNVKKSIENRDK